MLTRSLCLRLVQQLFIYACSAVFVQNSSIFQVALDILLQCIFNPAATIEFFLFFAYSLATGVRAFSQNSSETFQNRFGPLTDKQITQLKILSLACCSKQRLYSTLQRIFNMWYTRTSLVNSAKKVNNAESYTAAKVVLLVSIKLVKASKVPSKF